MGRIGNSIALAKASWEVLKADKELLLLPVISMVSTVIAVAVFFIPLLATDAGGASLLVLLALYFVLAYITIFFNAALISAAHERLEGGDPTVGSALRGAASRAGRILPWALISAVVSVILKAIEERAGFLGSIVVSLVGMAWNVVTFLVLPIIVIEGMGATESIKRSVNLFRQTWGENLGAQVGLGLVGFLAALPGVALILAGVGAGGAGLLPLLGLGVVWIVLVAVVMAALSGIFQTALYHFAVGGQAQSGYFDSHILSEAFQARRRRFGR
ncbi:MAG: hypothetical protein F4Z79_00445 [Acidimicrobiia bacterium]|nr:hypothetical protein [Acidimicrobiia bacterium]MYH05109.1 hypothetical protein [Acidimicrobiia bacterium]